MFNDKIQDLLEIISIGHDLKSNTYTLTSSDIGYIESTLKGMLNTEDSDGLVIRCNHNGVVRVYEDGVQMNRLLSVKFEAEVDSIPVLEIKQNI